MKKLCKNNCKLLQKQKQVKVLKTSMLKNTMFFSQLEKLRSHSYGYQSLALKIHLNSSGKKMNNK